MTTLVAPLATPLTTLLAPLATVLATVFPIFATDLIGFPNTLSATLPIVFTAFPIVLLTVLTAPIADFTVPPIILVVAPRTLPFNILPTPFIKPEPIAVIEFATPVIAVFAVS